ncbi:hypothetical protein AAH986_12080 [Enterococcus lactis]
MNARYQSKDWYLFYVQNVVAIITTQLVNGWGNARLDCMQR